MLRPQQEKRLHPVVCLAPSTDYAVDQHWVPRHHQPVGEQLWRQLRQRLPQQVAVIPQRHQKSDRLGQTNPLLLLALFLLVPRLPLLVPSS